MKGSLLLSTSLLAALLATSCGSDNALQSEPAGPENALTFTLRTPAGSKVIYGSRAIHDAPEYAINSLAMYEYEVTGEGDARTTVLRRIMKKDGNGNNAINWTRNADNSYTFSIIVPAENDGHRYTYRFVANDATVDPAEGSSFDDFAATKAAITVGEGQSADVLAAEENGIAMTGVAVCNGSEVITMEKGLSCDVALTRIVSRIDVRYQTPNLKVTKVELHGAPASGTLFPGTLTVPSDDEAYTMALNANTALPTDYLRALDTDTYTMEKAFYIYERANTAENHVTVHIEYSVAANDEVYVGAVDVPFCKTEGTDAGTYVDAERNHLYTIVLGNGKEPVAGHIRAQVVVADWTPVEIIEPLTEDDEEIN